MDNLYDLSGKVHLILSPSWICPSFASAPGNTPFRLSKGATLPCSVDSVNLNLTNVRLSEMTCLSSPQYRVYVDLLNFKIALVHAEIDGDIVIVDVRRTGKILSCQEQ